jgi:hypothetical protein
MNFIARDRRPLFVRTADYQACHARALSKAVNRIGSQPLYALHAARTHGASAG